MRERGSRFDSDKTTPSRSWLVKQDLEISRAGAGSMTNEPAKNLGVLIMGLRASGKSTLGPVLAQRLRLVFVDLDDVTAALLQGDTVAEVWQKHGQAAFRVAETSALDGLLNADVKVIAMGGGTPTAPGAAELINDARKTRKWRTVCLRAQPDTLSARLEKTDAAVRPSITGLGTLQEITQVFNQRDELYQSLADLVIDCDSLTTGELCTLVHDWITKQGSVD